MELPSYIQIEPVGQCNLRCQMCPIQYRTDGNGSTPAFMRWDLFQRLIDQMANLKHLHLQGLGEPMMHPRFFEMVEYASSRGVRVTTNTNLTLLSERRAHLCVTSGLNCVHVSIDGGTAETYERIRINGRFKRVTSNLAQLVQVKSARNSDTPEIRMVVVLMRQNLHELTRLVERAAQWGVKSIFVQHLCHDFGEQDLPDHYRPMRDFVQNQSLAGEDQNRVEAEFQSARQLADQLRIELRLPHAAPIMHPAGTPGRTRCEWPWTGAYFSYDGSAMPCCMISTPDRMKLGSAVTTTLDEIWNGDSYQSFRDQLGSDAPPSICESCSIYRGIF